MYFSASQLVTFYSNPRVWRERHIEGISSPMSSKALLGSLCHRWLECKQNKEEFIFDNEYDKLTLNTEYDFKPISEDQLKEEFKIMQEGTLPNIPLDNIVSFEERHTINKGDNSISGAWDAVVDHPMLGLTVRDYKTSDKKANTSLYRPQLCAYAFLYKDKTGEDIKRGEILTILRPKKGVAQSYMIEDLDISADDGYEYLKTMVRTYDASIKYPELAPLLYANNPFSWMQG